MSDERQDDEGGEAQGAGAALRLTRDGNRIQRDEAGRVAGSEAARQLALRRRGDPELLAYAKAIAAGAPPEKVTALLEYAHAQAMGAAHPLTAPKWAALYLNAVLTPEVKAAMAKLVPAGAAPVARLERLSRDELETLRRLHQKAVGAGAGVDVEVDSEQDPEP